MLKSLGKYIDNSGLDQAFVEPKIYGPGTLDQIKEGKPMKRSLEAFHTLYTTLFNIYIQNFLESHPLLEKELREGIIHAVTTLQNLSHNDKEAISENHTRILQVLNQISFFDEKKKYDESLENQGKFLFNFMKMFENLLLFIRATRQCLWEEHLASLDRFVKYFFVLDLQNYARYSPVYLSQMYNLQASDPETWDFLRSGSLSVSKSLIPFCSIGVDHALEQENRCMKVLGGIKGIANHQSALDQHFLITSEMNTIIDAFQNSLNLKSWGRTRDEHYQIGGGTNVRMMENVQKLMNVMTVHETTFEKSDSVYNIISKRVLPDAATVHLLDFDTNGETMYESFKAERMEAEKSIWDPMKKRNLSTFSITKKTTKVKLQDRIVTLKEDRRLMIRFIIASRKRPEMNLEKYIGDFEFSVVPRSLFTSDGKLLLETSKSAVMHEIKEAAQQTEDSTREQQQEEFAIPKVAIFDGMAVVNKIKLGPAVQNCQQLAQAFMEIVLSQATNAAEIRIVFDRYLESSLKESTREKRSKNIEVMEYEVKKDTSLQDITMKKFLAHINTK